MMSKTELQKLLENFRDSKGIERIGVMRSLRSFLNNHSMIDAGKMIMRIGDARDLDVLLGAGLREPLYSISMARKVQILYPEVFV